MLKFKTTEQQKQLLCELQEYNMFVILHSKRKFSDDIVAENDVNTLAYYAQQSFNSAHEFGGDLEFTWQVGGRVVSILQLCEPITEYTSVTDGDHQRTFTLSTQYHKNLISIVALQV